MSTPNNRKRRLAGQYADAEEDLAAREADLVRAFTRWHKARTQLRRIDRALSKISKAEEEEAHYAAHAAAKETKVG